MLSNRNSLDKPLDDQELDEIFAPFVSCRDLLLAVSGGADSIALMHLVYEWALRRHARLHLHIATVDHGLRAEAEDECRFVAKEAAHLGLSHEILKWHHEEPIARNIQAEARTARYQLLADHAGSLGCDHIVTAHHLDDQAETVLMRLIRGSGVSGLSGMVTTSRIDHFDLHRPLLSVPKSRLMASLKARGHNWIEDPSNRNEDFFRVRMRQMLPALAREGCDATRLAKTARRMARAEQALEAMTGDIFTHCFTPEPGRALSVDLRVYVRAEEEIRLRLLRASLRYVSVPIYPPREEGLVGLDDALMGAHSTNPDKKPVLKRTFGGCCFDLRQGRLWIYREPGRVVTDMAIDPAGQAMWYNLYEVELLDALEGVTLRPLGENGRLALAREGLDHSRFAELKGACPAGLIEACPALWRNAIPIAVVDWPEIARKSGVRVDFRGKDPRFTFNQAFG